MAYNAALNTVYNHYLTTYAPKGTTQFDTHKKSELRGIYNSIVKLNKESPLFILNNSKKSQEFAVGIKENARQLRNTIASLGGLSETEMLNKKAAFSSNESIATVSFIGDYKKGDEIPSIDIEVNKLASEQINLGNFLPSSQKTFLTPNAYSFDINLSDLNYEFQFNINEDETNQDVQNRLARLITNADIGLTADVVSDNKGNSSLRLTSTATGLPDDKEQLFKVTDNKTSKTSGAVSYFGIDYIARDASNAEFQINGEKRTALSNHFTVSKLYELRLTGVSSTEGETATIGLKNDVESLTENIGSLVKGYNSFIHSAAEYMEFHPKCGRLVNEMNAISNYFKDNLSTLGIQVQEDGQIEMDTDKFRTSMLSEDSGDSMSPIKDFTNSILRKTNQVSLNPMHYVDKTIVAYKNPSHNFFNPYVTSAYSGMMFNGYC